MLINNLAPLKYVQNSFSGTCPDSKLTRDVLNVLSDDTTITTDVSTDVSTTPSEDMTTTEDYFSSLSATDIATTTDYASISAEISDKFSPEKEIEEESYALVKLSLFLLVVLILTIAYFVKKYVKRHTGVYMTREDAGEAEALDADTAVLHSKTGHLVEKKQEWFF